eukprot:4462471-Amphidinium_carterae.2
MWVSSGQPMLGEEQYGHMVDFTSTFKWLKAHPAKAKHYNFQSKRMQGYGCAFPGGKYGHIK